MTKRKVPIKPATKQGRSISTSEQCALDKYIFAQHFDPTSVDGLRWPAFLAMWQRIGKDYAIGWIFWQATGLRLDRVTHEFGARTEIAAAQRLLCSIGMDMTDFDPRKLK